VPEEVTAALASTPRGLWHKDLDKLPDLVDTSGPTVYGMRDVAAVRQEAVEELAAVEAAAGGGGHGGRGNRTSAESAWLRLVRTAGTAADKVAAALVTAQGDPVGNGKALDALLDLADGARTAGGKRGAGQALDALRDLFTGALMPDRKLRRMEQQPVEALLATYRPGHPLRRQYLLGWGFEEALKGRHARLVACLGALSKDPLEWLKNKAMSVAAALLASKPEGERDLLALLINKLGDPGRRAASGAAHHLGEVLGKHPAMKGVVVRDVAHFAFRPRIGLRAVYAAVVFVTQIQLSHRGKDPEVAAQMVQLYFDLFQALLASDPPPPGAGEAGHGEGGAEAGSAAPGEAAKAKKAASKQKRGKGGRRPASTKKGRDKGKAAAPTSDAVSDASMGVDSRLLRALLTGVNRALPYVPADTADELVTRIAPAIFRVSHTSSAGGAVQALTLLFHMLAGRAAASDRFYRAIYALLLRPELPRSAAAAMALSLVFRAMRADVQPKRVAAFAKRLLQVSSPIPFPSHARAARGGMTKSSGTLCHGAKEARSAPRCVLSHSTRDFRPHARALAASV
jgi:ribosome biogenesis protein MAK21